MDLFENFSENLPCQMTSDELDKCVEQQVLSLDSTSWLNGVYRMVYVDKTGEVQVVSEHGEIIARNIKMHPKEAKKMLNSVIFLHKRMMVKAITILQCRMRYKRLRWYVTRIQRWWRENTVAGYVDGFSMAQKAIHKIVDWGKDVRILKVRRVIRKSHIGLKDQQTIIKMDDILRKMGGPQGITRMGPEEIAQSDLFLYIEVTIRGNPIVVIVLNRRNTDSPYETEVLVKGETVCRTEWTPPGGVTNQIDNAFKTLT